MGSGPSHGRDPQTEGSVSSESLEGEDDEGDDIELLSPVGSLAGLQRAARAEGFAIAGGLPELIHG